MDYASLSLSEVRKGLDAVARDAEATFAELDERQLNWRQDPARWSVGQCFDHLVRSQSPDDKRYQAGNAERAGRDSRHHDVAVLQLPHL
jgi:hypothetical protein